VPEMASISMSLRCSRPSSTPQVKAPWEPPPCSARRTRRLSAPTPTREGPDRAASTLAPDSLPACPPRLSRTWRGEDVGAPGAGEAAWTFVKPPHHAFNLWNKDICRLLFLPWRAYPIAVETG